MQPPHLKHKTSLMKHNSTVSTVKQNNYTMLLFSLFPILCWKALNITHIQMVEDLHFL